MNCHFCNSQINLSNYQIDDQDQYIDVYCNNFNCKKYEVLYKFKDNQYIAAQLKTKINNNTYIVNYWIEEKQIIIVQQIPDIFVRSLKDPFVYEKIIELPFTRYIYTPTNIDDKLYLTLLIS